MTHGLAPEVREGLGAIGRVAAALVGSETLDELATQALSEMRDALSLEAAALYLPHAGPRPMLERFAVCEAATAELTTREEIVFDEESWRLTVQGGLPLVLREPANWLMDHPFDPPASSWMLLPLGAGGRMTGVAIAAAREPIALTPTAGAVLTMVGDLLSAGIATARLRQELQRTALERERMRLAAEVHDGLAQDLALAMRELTLLDRDLPPEAVAASRQRLREAVASAHATVRGRLKEMTAPTPLGGVQPAVRELCDRFAHRGLDIRLDVAGDLPEPSTERTTVILRVLAEALTNIEKHAEARHVGVGLSIRDGETLVLAIEDDGLGFDTELGPRPLEDHLGMRLMHERARAAGGNLAISAARRRGTHVELTLPVAADRD